MLRDEFLFTYLSQVEQPFKVLDVGAGLGQVSEEIRRRFDAKCECIDVVWRPNVGVKEFDGRALRYEENSFDYVLFNFVLHHAAQNATQLLRDALRVASRAVLIHEDLDNGDSAVQRILHEHDPKAVFYSAEGWKRVFSELGGELVLFKEFPEWIVEDFPQMAVPRAFAVVRAASSEEARSPGP